MKSVRIINDGSVTGTRVYDEKGDEIHGIFSITWRHSAQDFPQCEIVLGFTYCDIDGDVKVYAAHPKTGKMLEVDKIHFVDGQEWNLEE